MQAQSPVPEHRWDQTVDRRLVHRDAVAEVLLTQVAPVGNDRFTICAQWPRGHRVFRPDEFGRADPMLLLETVRQAGLAVSHLGFGVPLDWRSLMLDVGFELLTDEPASRTEVVATLHCTDIRRRGTRLGSMTVRLTLGTDDRAFATGSGTVRWLPGSVYRALRARSMPQPGPGRADVFAVPTRDRAAADSLLAAPGGDPLVRVVVVPLGHPVYFDHPLDHVPGMVLVDAAWQAVRDLLPGARLQGCRMSLPAFTELGPVVQVRLQPASTEVRFRITQDDRPTATGSFVTWS